MTAGWKAAWQQQATRIDALTLRERVFLFISLMACLLALADVLWLSPARVAHKQLTQRFAAQNTELQRAREVLKTLAQPIDASQAVGAELAAVMGRLAQINQRIEQTLPGAHKGAPLAPAMVHLLQQHAGLTLLRTTTLEPGAGAGPTAAGAGFAAGAAPLGLTRQGVSLTVAGAYPELIRYLQALERELPQARWGTMTLSGDKRPPELTLQLYLLGVQP